MLLVATAALVTTAAALVTTTAALQLKASSSLAFNITQGGADFWELAEEIAAEHAANCSSSRPPDEGGFINGFAEAISVILVSEIGDKTFFIAAILAMQNNKLVVFLSALAALFVMTILSGLLGWVATYFIPREYTYWTCTAIMFLFGVKMLWESWRMDPDEAEETRKEVELELGNLSPNTDQDEDQKETPANQEPGVEGEAATCSSRCAAVWRWLTRPLVAGYDWLVGTAVVRALIRLDRAAQHRVDLMEEAVQRCFRSMRCKGKKNSISSSQEEGESTQNSPSGADMSQARSDTAEDPAAPSTPGAEIRTRPSAQQSWFGKKCLQIFKLFVKGFTMTFIAEWGDRSQLATIVLVGIYDVWGVIVGGCLGHFICTGVAVVCGALIARFISVRMVTFLGALVFLGFAISSIFTFEEDVTPEKILCYLYNNTANLTATYFWYNEDYALQLLE